jgi:RNA polymerase sigma factor (TIGR02999 family)
MSTDPGTITALLAQWSDGDPDAYPRLITLAYDDLRAIAHRRRQGGDGEGLATTALVHEAYLKLAGRQGGVWAGRSHFFAFASRAMRNILVDHARREHAASRGGKAVRISLDEHSILHFYILVLVVRAQVGSGRQSRIRCSVFLMKGFCWLIQSLACHHMPNHKI